MNPARRRAIWRGIFLAVGILAAGLFWQQVIRPHVVPKRFGEVAAGKVYRSGKLTPGATRLVHDRHRIKTIVDLGAYPVGSRQERLAQETAEALGVERYRFDLSGDATGNPNYYLFALRLMNDPAKQPILVNCGAGTERTGCAVALYRHLVEGVPMDKAYAEADAAGHDPDRNPHLKEVLDRWEAPIGVAFKDGGLVAGAAPVPDPQPVPSPQ